MAESYRKVTETSKRHNLKEAESLFCFCITGDGGSRETAKEGSMVDGKPLTPPILPEDSAREIADPANSILVVHWWAVWNNYDRELDRRIQLLRPQFEPRVRFRSFDVDLPDGFEITRQYGLQSIPALFCFLHGKYYEKLLGVGTYERTQATLTAWASAGSAKK